MAALDGLATVLSEHEGRIFSYFRRMGVDVQSAQDLSQDTFVRAIAGATRFRGEASAVAWLLGIARNVYREWVRSQMRARSAAERTAAPGAAVVEDFEGSDLDVATVLLTLEPDVRELLVLRYVLDMSSESVATLLGISDAATRQRVVRAKAAFRRAWEGCHAGT